MSNPLKGSFHSLGNASDYDPYHDDLGMGPRQIDDARSPAVNSPRMSDTSPYRPTHQSFRSSLSLIPTPGTFSKRHPTFEPVPLQFWVVAMGCALLAILGFTLEVALRISNRNGGFDVPPTKMFSFSFSSTKIWTSFLPSLIFAPLAFMVLGFDWAIRLWNPYLILSRGNASADETLLIDYIADSRVFVIYNALRFRHRFVLVSALTALASLLFQPLAGSILSIQQIQLSSASTVQSIMAVGLSPDINNLIAFAASAGYAEASVFNDLPDPPFTCGGWATAEFVFPTDEYLNGSMSINTTGIATSVNCALPNQISINSSIATNWTASVVSADGCALTASFDPNDADQQAGVQNVPDCGSNTTDPTFQPVLFWFWQQEPSGFSAVFCEPSIGVYDVTAFASLNNGSLTNISVNDHYRAANNVSGAPLNYIPYNGLIFNSSTNVNVQSRATSIRSGVPYAVFRLAHQAPGGMAAAFQSPLLFVNYTEQVYTQHLALATVSNYFTPSNSTVNAVLDILVPRLVIVPLAAHALATLCLLTASIIFFLHLWHFRERRDIYLAHPPGSIGSAVALTSHSDFGELLMPYDNVATFSRKLSPFRFCLDGRTGAIVVDDSAIAYAGEPSTLATGDETMMTLIGKDPRHQHKDSLGADTPPGT